MTNNLEVLVSLERIKPKQKGKEVYTIYDPIHFNNEPKRIETLIGVVDYLTKTYPPTNYLYLLHLESDDVIKFGDLYHKRVGLND